MKVVVKEIFYCEYCKRRYFFRKRMERHERFCIDNPHLKEYNHKCTKCVNSEREDPSNCKRRNVHFKCNLYNKRIHTLTSGRKQFVNIDGCELMPKDCNAYEERLSSPTPSVTMRIDRNGTTISPNASYVDPSTGTTSSNTTSFEITF